MNKFFMCEPDGRIHTVCGRESDLLPMPRDGYIFRPWRPMEPPGPPTPTSVAYWIGGVDGAPQWVEMGLIDQRRAALAQEISSACRAQIEQGFACAALGAQFVYPAKQLDQANLIASVTDSLLFADDPDWLTPFWCADEAGAWEFRMHTRAQIQQVGRAGKASILAAMQKNEILQRQIASASAEQLQTITW